MEYEYLSSIMTPAIALLILSTTMRLGNVRLALTEIAKIPGAHLDTMDSYVLFRDRAMFLCRGLRMLNVSMLILIPSALAKLFLQQEVPALSFGIIVFDVLFFVVLFCAVYFLFKESQLTGRSIIAHTNEIKASHQSVDN